MPWRFRSAESLGPGRKTLSASASQGVVGLSGAATCGDPSKYVQSIVCFSKNFLEVLFRFLCNLLPRDLPRGSSHKNPLTPSSSGQTRYARVKHPFPRNQLKGKTVFSSPKVAGFFPKAPTLWPALEAFRQFSGPRAWSRATKRPKSAQRSWHQRDWGTLKNSDWKILVACYLWFVIWSAFYV